jgi:hypothetical protein
LNAEDRASDVLDHVDDLNHVRNRIVDHVRAADPHEAEAASAQLDSLIERWKQEAEIARGEGSRLYYRPQGRGHTSLLVDFGKQGGIWETAQSMRSVDRDCLVIVKGA